ncbi:MAG: HAMP domain-containing sensor histidine kinase [Pseudomonadota bacterium]
MQQDHTISIHDNGQGISPANMEKIFTPFFTTKREQGGTGLGLVIIRSLLNAYNAEIRCKPSNTGAIFVILFP